MRLDSCKEVPGGNDILIFNAPSLKGGKNSRPISGNNMIATTNRIAETPMISTGRRSVHCKILT